MARSGKGGQPAGRLVRPLAAVPRGGGRQLLTGAEVEADKEGRASWAMRGERGGRRGPWFSREGWGWCQRGSLRLDLEVEEGS